jgi:hypothetical protein
VRRGWHRPGSAGAEGVASGLLGSLARARTRASMPRMMSSATAKPLIAGLCPAAPPPTPRHSARAVRFARRAKRARQKCAQLLLAGAPGAVAGLNIDAVRAQIEAALGDVSSKLDQSHRELSLKWVPGTSPAGPAKGWRPAAASWRRACPRKPHACAGAAAPCSALTPPRSGDVTAGPAPLPLCPQTWPHVSGSRRRWELSRPWLRSTTRRPQRRSKPPTARSTA